MTTAADAPTHDVVAQDATMRLGRGRALDGLTCTIPAGTVTALVGPNGAGKSTFGLAMNGRRALSSGTITVAGRPTFNTTSLRRNVCLVSDRGEYLPDRKLSESLAMHAGMRPAWDAAEAGRLLDVFQLHPKQRPNRMSRGMRSAASIVIGLASGCRVTMFDEATVGLDAGRRETFAREIIHTATETDRTLIIATHLIDEVDALAQHIVVMKRGRAIFSGDADDLRGRIIACTGTPEQISSFIGGRTILGRESLGVMERVTISCATPGDATDALHHAREAGIGTQTLGLQQSIVRLTQ